MKGITIELKVKTQSGTDPFGTPIYSESWEDVDNILIGEQSSADVINELSLTGKHLAYTLAIPKGDTHEWKDTEVKFFGETFRTYGEPTQGIEELIPLSWNKKVKVERYG